MNAVSRKRKNQDTSLTELGNPCKRSKLVEIILQKDLVEEKEGTTENNVMKRRNKLLTALHLKRKYKYYCKKHNNTYLVESVRQKARISSKENRHHFVQRFRSLNVCADSCKSDSVIASEEIKSTARLNQVDCDNNNGKNREEDCFIKPRLPIRMATQHDLTKNNISFDEDKISVFSCDYSIIESSISELSTRSNRKNRARRDAYFQEDEDSDCSQDSENLRCKKSKVVKSFIVRKNPEGNIIFSDAIDYIDSDIDSKDGNCDCDYHENLKTNFCNYKWESSSDEDDLDTSSTSLYTG